MKKLYEIKFVGTYILLILLSIACADSAKHTAVKSEQAPAKSSTLDCKNDNPFFDKESFNSKAYKEALNEEFKTRDEYGLTYRLLDVIDKNGKSFLLAEGREKGICIKLEMRVYDWRGIEELEETKGVGFEGAELEGLEFGILRKGDNLEFMYQGVSALIQ